MLDFPDAPTIGQSFPPYTWDGARWTCSNPVGRQPPSDTNPLVNGVNIPGLETKYARGDHTHPTDTSRAPTNNATLTGTTSLQGANITGNVLVTGTFNASANRNALGTASGNISPPLKADANIVLYDADVDNWAGIGADSSGQVWFRTGLSGTPGPALLIDATRKITFLKTPTAPTPGVGDNSKKIATTKFVFDNPATGPYIPLNADSNVTGRLDVGGGDWRVYRSDGTGVVYLGNTGARYIYYNGSSYQLNGAHAYSANGRLWGANDFTAYPIRDIRLAYLADPVYGQGVGFSEPYGGGVMTGCDDYAGTGVTCRFRQFQALTSSWWAVGYA